MDGLMDTLITVAVVAFFLLSSYTKAKKKQARQERQKQQRQQQHRPASSRPMYQDEDAKPMWQEVFETQQKSEVPEPSIASSSYEEIPKKQSYFTYETLEPEIQENDREGETSFGETVEKCVQNIDSEEEKKLQISLDLEDIYKGVVYSEILKRPYN